AASGADDVFDPAAHERPGRALRALTGGAHVAFEFVGHAASVELGLDSVAAGGRLVVVGVGLERPRLPPVVRLVGMELTVSGSFGSTMAELEAVVTLLEQERIDVSRSVARHVGLDEAAAIFDTASGPGRTVIHPNGTGAGAHVGT
ncbi:MAG: zinc-binding dehydrogenase, partial [Acidimicrobiia bacterium]|nr:zinc-binding dehydrogenase [Acidimicrobiia bacterium]